MKQLTKHILLTLAIIIIASSISFAQTFTIQSNKDSILIGEPFNLSVQYTVFGATSQLSFEKGDSLGNGFEVLEVESTDTIKGTLLSQQLMVTCFELDNQFIPAFSIYYDSNKVVSKPIPVHVSLMQVDTAQPIKDIKPIVYDELTAGERLSMVWNWMKKYWFVWIPILLGLLFLIWFLFIKKKTEKATIVPEKEIIPAHILANSRLKELEEKQLWQSGKQKEYNVQLTEVIQEYITNRYNVPTSERTSSEIIQSLRFVEMGEENKAN
ncbi:MAG: hypothetical protein ABF240_09090, partial [Flavobacteriales bacterium]